MEKEKETCLRKNAQKDEETKEKVREIEDMKQILRKKELEF